MPMLIVCRAVQVLGAQAFGLGWAQPLIGQRATPTVAPIARTGIIAGLPVQRPARSAVP